MLYYNKDPYFIQETDVQRKYLSEKAYDKDMIIFSKY